MFLTVFLHRICQGKQGQLVDTIKKFLGEKENESRNFFNLCKTGNFSGAYDLTLVDVENNLWQNYQTSDCGNTALHYLIENFDPQNSNINNINCRNKLLKRIIQEGALNNLQNNLGETPLHIAVKKGDVLAINLLIDAGCNPNIANKNGDTPLHLAVNNPVILEEVLKGFPDPSVSNDQLHTPRKCAELKQSQIILANYEKQYSAAKEKVTQNFVSKISQDIRESHRFVKSQQYEKWTDKSIIHKYVKFEKKDIIGLVLEGIKYDGEKSYYYWNSWESIVLTKLPNLPLDKEKFQLKIAKELDRGRS